MKILSVDDSTIIRRIIRGAIEVMGFDCLEAENGKVALEILAKEAVDLIILDWNMPELDGYSTLLAIKADPALKHIPVMMVTTESEKNNVIKAIQAGASYYVTKPFSQEDLMTLILESTGAACN